MHRATKVRHVSMEPQEWSPQYRSTYRWYINELYMKPKEQHDAEDTRYKHGTRPGGNLQYFEVILTI